MSAAQSVFYVPQSDSNFYEIITFPLDCFILMSVNIQIKNDLPAGSRAVFTLKALEGYDHQEIAEFLEVPVSTSKSQFSRAKELLRAALLKTVES